MTGYAFIIYDVGIGAYPVGGYAYIKLGDWKQKYES